MLFAVREYARFAPPRNARVFLGVLCSGLEKSGLRGTRDTCLRAVACCVRAARVVLFRRHCRGRGFGDGEGGLVLLDYGFGFQCVFNESTADFHEDRHGLRRF